MERQELKEKIQKLIDFSLKLGERSKNLNKLLYQQLYEITELEKLEKLEGKFLEAYLLWKSITRANYQPELLKVAPTDREKLLAVIEKEVELIELNNQREISNELTNEELLKQLGTRIKSGKIKRDWETIHGEGDGCSCLYFKDEDNKNKFSVLLETGGIVKEKLEND